MRILHCSDFHFDKYYREHALSVLKELTEMQHSLGVDVVLVAGDFFESIRQPSQFVEDVAEGFLAFPAPMIAIPGNHDLPRDQRDPTSELFSLIKDKGIYLSSPEGETIITADGKLRVWGRGMPDHNPMNDPLANLESMNLDSLWNIVMAHGQVVENRENEILSSPILFADHDPAIRTVHYVALGHYHIPFQTTYGDTIVHGPGAASSLIGTGSVTVLDLSDEEDLSITSHSLHS